MKISDNKKGVLGSLAIFTVQIGVALAGVRWFQKRDEENAKKDKLGNRHDNPRG